MSFIQDIAYRPMVGDPDDHRPESTWALVFDPPRDDAPFVEDITCIFERMAPGHSIPLHTHATSELVMIEHGTGEYRLGDRTRRLRAGALVFIPAGTPHGLHNDGGEVLALRAVFPTRTLDLTYLERNPAPGTEGDPPQPTLRLDPRVDPY